MMWLSDTQTNKPLTTMPKSATAPLTILLSMSAFSAPVFWSRRVPHSKQKTAAPRFSRPQYAQPIHTPISYDAGSHRLCRGKQAVPSCHATRRLFRSTCEDDWSQWRLDLRSEITRCKVAITAGERMRTGPTTAPSAALPLLSRLFQSRYHFQPR